jgi:hypothetical protein
MAEKRKFSDPPEDIQVEKDNNAKSKKLAQFSTTTVINCKLIFAEWAAYREQAGKALKERLNPPKTLQAKAKHVVSKIVIN